MSKKKESTVCNSVLTKTYPKGLSVSMQSSLHWSEKRASFSRLFIMELTSWSLCGEESSENEALMKRTVTGDRRRRIKMNTDDWVGTRGCLAGTAEPGRNTCLPDDKHVNGPIWNVWSEQRSDVIWRDGWSHVPCDDVHPVRGQKQGDIAALDLSAIPTVG